MRNAFHFQPEEIKKALESAQESVSGTRVGLNEWLKGFQPDPLEKPRPIDEVMLSIYTMATDFMEQMDKSSMKEEKVTNLVLSFLHFMNVGITMVDGEFSGGDLKGN
jgi:hypothetical protein